MTSERGEREEYTVELFSDYAVDTRARHACKLESMHVRASMHACVYNMGGPVAPIAGAGN